MKNLKLILGSLLLGVFIFGSALQTFAQKVLPAITITASNYKYLNAINPEVAAQPVSMLEHYAAAYDIKGAEFYEDEYDTYVVSFFIPDGKILAAYDKDGKLLRTAEKFKEVAVPNNVRLAVAKRFPNWTIANDVYLVRYREANDGRVTKQLYKLVLQNGEQRMRVKINDVGEFL